MKIGIYKIESPTGRIYVGQSTNIDVRWKQYENLDRRSMGPKIYNSLKKYGWEDHSKDIIEECRSEQLDEREVYWKQYYLSLVNNKMNRVLFCEIYDKGGGPKSDETKRKQSKSQQINLNNPLIVEKRRINCKISGNEPGVQQKAVDNTDWESRNKKLSKPIIQYDLEGNEIKIWNGASEIQRDNPGFWGTEITKCCTGRSKQYKNFIWKYQNPDTPKRKYGKIIQYDVNDILIKEWDSVKEISLFYNMRGQNLHACLKGRYKTILGFKWKYK